MYQINSEPPHDELQKQRLLLQQILEEKKNEQRETEFIYPAAVSECSENLSSSYDASSSATLTTLHTAYVPPEDNVDLSYSKSQNLSQTGEGMTDMSSGCSSLNNRNDTSIASTETPLTSSAVNETVSDDGTHTTTVIMFGPEHLSQPRKKKAPKKVVCVNKMDLTYQCEWYACEEATKDISQYFNHVEQHIKSLDRLTEDVRTVCLWRDCEATFPDMDELVRHIYFHGFHTKLKAVGQHLIDNLYEMNCELDPDSRNLLPQIPEPFECQWDECAILFASAEQFYFHVASHVNSAQFIIKGDNAKGKYKCGWSDCTLLFEKPAVLREHCKSHIQEKVAGCPNCGATFSSYSKFKSHLERQAPLVDVVYQCTFCARRFATETLVREHVRYHIHHIRCPHCDMTCSSQAALNSHILFRHSKMANLPCPHCDKRLKTRLDLHRHVITHTDSKLFRCNFPQCGYRAKNSQTMDRHIKRAHVAEDTPVYTCHICEQQFTTGAGLTKHLMGEHNLTWPSGHSKFCYRRSDDGKYRLQTIRYESFELTEGVDKISKMIDMEASDEEDDCDAVLQPEQDNEASTKEKTQTRDGQSSDGAEQNKEPENQECVAKNPLTSTKRKASATLNANDKKRQRKSKQQQPKETKDVGGAPAKKQRQSRKKSPLRKGKQKVVSNTKKKAKKSSDEAPKNNDQNEKQSKSASTHSKRKAKTKVEDSKKPSKKNAEGEVIHGIPLPTKCST